MNEDQRIDRVIHSAPVSPQAARVVSGGVNHPIPSPHRDLVVSPAPLPVRPMPPDSPVKVGDKFGWLTIVGLSATGSIKQKASWVVRCVCGRYTTRKLEAMRREVEVIGIEPKCPECLYREGVKNGTRGRCARCGSQARGEFCKRCAIEKGLPLNTETLRKWRNSHA